MLGYFDHNATAPLLPEAREAWLRASQDHWHNASGLYREAGATKRVLEDARERIAEHLGAAPQQLVFTSGASESNHSLLSQQARIKENILLSSAEHPSVSESAVRFFGHNVQAVYPTELANTIESADEGSALVSCMAANNETGVIYPWADLARRCRERGLVYHCDAAQWIGRLDATDFGTSGAFVTGSGHKFGGSNGVGFLLVPEGQSFVGQVGGPQEARRRAGTEDVAGIAAMVAALDASLAKLPGDPSGRDGFEKKLKRQLHGVRILADDATRLWNTSMFLLPPPSGNLKFIARLSAAGFAASTGSACSAGKNNPSPSLSAEGVTPEDQRRAVRVSSGLETSSGEWDSLLSAVVEVAKGLEKNDRSGGLDLANL